MVALGNRVDNLRCSVYRKGKMQTRHAPVLSSLPCPTCSGNHPRGTITIDVADTRDGCTTHAETRLCGCCSGSGFVADLDAHADCEGEVEDYGDEASVCLARVPCTVCHGAGTCMLCDDDGMVPVEVAS